MSRGWTRTRSVGCANWIDNVLARESWQNAARSGSGQLDLDLSTFPGITSVVPAAYYSTRPELLSGDGWPACSEVVFPAWRPVRRVELGDLKAPPAHSRLRWGGPVGEADVDSKCNPASERSRLFCAKFAPAYLPHTILCTPDSGIHLPRLAGVECICCQHGDATTVRAMATGQAMATKQVMSCAHALIDVPLQRVHAVIV
ncbi:hypothetical protein EJ06DRAFT_274929 [Trichodelitschia bisporula]|uniref:Uncharacterized protein n=1 Tax=Trichodelitschia bisporula TaxID=703511 RepID=A0A6G1I4Z9_9PEZI|nr:hypothetical protein EJ06DRAFT_274929 [Trichodelitschia bisporula]